MRVLALLALVLAVAGGAAAEEAPLYGVLTHPWTLQLSASQPKQVPKEYVISVEAPAGANLPLGKAYYGVFVADDAHAALIVDLTPAVTGETEDAVVVDPNAVSGRLPPAVKFRQRKPAHLAKGALLALSLETKPLPVALSLKMVRPEGLTIKVGKFQVKLNRELLEGLARVLATYEYCHPHGKKTPVGYLQALVFKYFVKASVTGAKPEELQKLEVSEEEKEEKKKEENEEKTVDEETGYALRAFLEVNEQQGLTGLKAEFSVENLENLIGEAVAVLRDVLSSPEAQQAAATAESALKKFVQVPVAAVCLLGIALVAARRR